MRKLLLAALGLIFMNSAYAATSEEIPLCSAFHFKSVKAKLLESNNDKYMHCAVSCMLARRCGALDSYQIGILKEVWDCLLYTSPSPRDKRQSRMPSSA